MKNYLTKSSLHFCRIKKLYYLSGDWLFMSRYLFLSLSPLIHTMQILLRLEKIYKELSERYGGEPSFMQWAIAAGVDQTTLRRQINCGTFCKDKMIKSNVRLVVSIAKKYLGTGMNLEDLVQVPICYKNVHLMFHRPCSGNFTHYLSERCQ